MNQEIQERESEQVRAITQMIVAELKANGKSVRLGDLVDQRDAARVAEWTV